MGFYPRLFEGVADKYAEKEFYIPQEQEYENDKIHRFELSQENHDVIISKKYRCKIYKNPKSLTKFQPNIRTVICKNGDMYMSNENRVTHSMLLEELGLKNLIIYIDPDKPENRLKKKDWWNEVPKEFACMVRIDKTSRFAIGESYGPMDPETLEPERVHFMMPEIETMQAHFKDFIKMAKRRNPQFHFINKSIKGI